MMELACTLARSPRRLCEGVEPELELREGERLVRRPFNHYAPALTDWWIVPSLELPFFRFGKYFFTWDEKKRDTLQCGFGVTKGLDPMLKKVYPSKKGRRLLMEENWGWQFFYPAMMRGELAELLRTAGAGIGHKLELIFEGGYVDDPGLFNRSEAGRDVPEVPEQGPRLEELRRGDDDPERRSLPVVRSVHCEYLPDSGGRRGDRR